MLSVTMLIGGASNNIISNSLFNFSNIISNCLFSRSSDGFEGNKPEGITNRLSICVLKIAFFNSSSKFGLSIVIFELSKIFASP